MGARFGREAGSRSGRPDLVLVVWDTCRGDRVSVNGYGRPTTPRLARLAASGTTFRRCYTPSPWTPPSHASMFTGLLPSGHGLGEKTGAMVHPALPLLATTLSGAGYETVAASANVILVTTGLLEGFDVVLPATPGAEKDVGDVIVARIDRWFRSRAGRTGPRRPLFLFVNLMDCHLPLAPSAEDVAGALGEEGPRALAAVGAPIYPQDAYLHHVGVKPLPAPRLRGQSAIYDAAVHATDRATGGVLDLLVREGRFAGSVVAVVGDHGECIGEHGEMEHRHTVLDPVLHVPLVVRWPGRLDAGRIEDAQVRVQDLYRTLLDAAGIAPPQGCGTDSISLGAVPLEPRIAVAELGSCIEQHRGTVPAVPDAAQERFLLRRVVIREAASGPSPRKYVVAAREGPGRGAAVADEALFDLRTDPGEERNLLGPGGRPEDRAAADRLKAGFAPLFR